MRTILQTAAVLIAVCVIGRGTSPLYVRSAEAQNQPHIESAQSISRVSRSEVSCGLSPCPILAISQPSAGKVKYRLDALRVSIEATEDKLENTNMSLSIRGTDNSITELDFRYLGPVKKGQIISLDYCFGSGFWVSTAPSIEVKLEFKAKIIASGTAAVLNL